MRRLELEVTASSDAPGKVRRALDTWMSDVECSEATSLDASLVVSELVTNAILHAQSLRRVIFTVGDGRLRIEVHDDESAPPHLRSQAGPHGGFGLRLVAAAAADWGWSPTPTGKLVWMEMYC